MTPLQQDRASAVTLATTVSTLASAAYVLLGRLQLSTIMGAAGFAALTSDWRVTSIAFSTAPTSGVLALVFIPRDFAGNAGPTPTANLVPNGVKNLNISFGASNSSTTPTPQGVDTVLVPFDCDVYLYNGTNQTLSAGVVVQYMAWSPAQ